MAAKSLYKNNERASTDLNICIEEMNNLHHDACPVKRIS